MQVDTTKKSKRYVLCKKEGDAVRPCAFFNTPTGCRSGSACQFSHGSMQSVTPTTSVPALEKKRKTGSRPPEGENIEKRHKKYSVDSSHRIESGNDHISETNKKNETVTPAPHKHNGSVAFVPFSPPGFSLHKLQNDEDTEDTQFLFSAVNTALKQGDISSPSPAMPSNASKTHQRVVLQGGDDVASKENTATDFFVSNDHVHRVLQTSGTEHATHGKVLNKKRKSKSPSTSKTDWSTVNRVNVDNPHGNYPHSTDAGASTPAYGQTVRSQVTSDLGCAVPIAPALFQAPVLPQTANSHPLASDKSGIESWFPLMTLTEQAPKYQSEYKFAKDSEWVHAKPFGDWCASLPPVLGIDCEMCETIDPVTGLRNSLALVRMSVINGINPKEVLIDTLVAPTMPISTMREHIHGITQDALRDVTFTLRHAQAALLNICSDRTILVGHALHHDLKSIKFDHRRVVDTSYLFQLDNQPNATPGLREVAKVILSASLSPIHDSVQDAQIAVNLAEHVRVNGLQKPIQRMGCEENRSTLLVHRIPHTCNEDTLRQLFVSATYVVPLTIQSVTHTTQSLSSPSGKTNVIFASPEHASLAFNSLAGPERPDKSNRPQKRVYLKQGGYICIRKY